MTTILWTTIIWTTILWTAILWAETRCYEGRMFARRPRFAAPTRITTATTAIAAVYAASCGVSYIVVWYILVRFPKSSQVLQPTFWMFILVGEPD